MLQKQAPPPDTPGKSPVTKKRTSGARNNMTMMLDSVEWPLLDTFWQIVGELISKMYIKSQPSLDEYTLAAKHFLACLSFIVRGFNKDQINVIFCATIPNLYSTPKKEDKIRASKSWESTHMWVKN
ncbi:hypothetical protein [uncultured Nostoc sp.]|uniref:hypothetical protein n=1 Tax=uncultured Nostoc sp. TaxID=340711 RepID=UPI0035CC3037